MTTEEKTILARFIDLASDTIRGNYRGAPAEYSFAEPEEDTAPEEDAAPAGFFSGDSLDAIAGGIRNCTRCALCKTRTNVVPGEGVEKPLVMIIGEGPGAEEDASGRPFVGKSGQLLDRMLDSRGQIGLYRDKNCFIANMVKCRPPNDRDPLPEETAACAPFLLGQIRLLAPRIILCVGRVAANGLLGKAETMGKLRGRFYDFKVPGKAGTEAPLTIPVLPTYHPSALLRNESLKAPAWEDMKILRSKLAELDSAYAPGPGVS
jgi:DNA polymerase